MEKCMLCRKEVEFIEEVKVHNGTYKLCQACARKREVDEMVKKLKPLVEQFFRAINSTAFNRRDVLGDALIQLFITQHRYLQGEAGNFLWHQVIKLARLFFNRPSLYLDGRNEHLADMALALTFYTEVRGEARKQAKRCWGEKE